MRAAEPAAGPANRETDPTDETTVSNIHRAIDRFKELRTALISAAVMGKIDVRAEVAP